MFYAKLSSMNIFFVGHSQVVDAEIKEKLKEILSCYLKRETVNFYLGGYVMKWLEN